MWIALGEYGRLDLAPHSPVDLLLLVKSPLKVESGSALEKLLGVLQSLPSEVRVWVLTIKECLQRAQNCFPFSFGLLGARRVAGDSAAFHDLVQRSRANLFKNQMPFFFEMADYLKAMRAADSVSLVESDLKLDAGGLLEIYAFMSCMKVLVGSDQPDRILAQAAVDVREWKQLDDARQHLTLIRNHLHFLEGRRQDRFVRERVLEVSGFLRYRSRHPAVASGLLLRDTLRQRQRVHQIVSRFLRRAKARSSAGSDAPKLRYLRLTPPASPDLRKMLAELPGRSTG